MTNKEKYHLYCKKINYIPFFSQAWWLEAVSIDGNWDVILIEENNHLFASLPYFFKKRGKKIDIIMPPLTQNLGIFINYPKDLQKKNKNSFEKKIISEVIEQLESLNLRTFRQNFFYKFDNWLPFYWSGFSQTTRYSYQIDFNKIPNFYENFHKSKKYEIQQSKKKVDVIKSLDYKLYYELMVRNLENRNKKITFSFELFENISKSAIKKDSCMFFFAKDNTNTIFAGLMLLYDSSISYNLSMTINPKVNRNAMSLLIYKSIEYAKNRSEIFDFEGSMIKSIEHVYSKFTSTRKSYYTISKYYSLPSFLKYSAGNFINFFTLKR